MMIANKIINVATFQTTYMSLTNMYLEFDTNFNFQIIFKKTFEMVKNNTSLLTRGKLPLNVFLYWIFSHLALRLSTTE